MRLAHRHRKNVDNRQAQQTKLPIYKYDTTAFKLFGHIQLTDAQKQRVDALLCESDSVRHFVTRCVVADPAGTVTVRKFESHVCDHMIAIHRARKRTDIQRNGKNQRGYARVSLQDDMDIPPPTPEPFQQELVPF